MTTAAKPRDPELQMGIYTELSEVPDRYRLYQHAQAYAGRDVWEEFIEDHRENHGVSDWWCTVAQRAGKNWKSHIEARDRHHALATPKDVEAWFTELLDSRAMTTVYPEYWTKLEQFYTWLQHHTDHPHVYHPVYMAAAHYPTTREVWDHKLAERETGDNA